MENEALRSFSLKVLVENEKNKVVFVESNKDFIDVLFSFMTMPIGTVIRLTREQLLRGQVGCLNNLYGSVEKLGQEFFQSEKCRDILLHPRSAAEIYCRNLNLNLIDSDSKAFYACNNGNCDLVSYYQTARCHCGEVFDRVVKLPSPISVSQEGGVFVKPTARFMISDDFQVRPMSTMTGLTLLRNLNGSTVEERTVDVGRDEVLKLLKCSLVSRTPFSDTLMEPSISKPSYRICRGKYGPRSMEQFRKVMGTLKMETVIHLKLIINKPKNLALYAEVEEDFVDLLCSFLKFPLGYVFKEFPCLSSKGCMGNLYKSIKDTDIKFFESEEMKELLVNPKLAPGLAYKNQLIDIKEALNPTYSTLTKSFGAVFSELKSKSHHGEVKTGEGFIEGPSTFMVKDNLKITPLSPITGISFIKSLKIPLNDIEEQDVTMGDDEALRLLVASLVSQNALTDAFLLKEPKQQAKSSEVI